MDTRLIARTAKNAPTTPGVYIWRGKNGRVLYVGKAVNLRSRLSSYAKTKDPRIIAMVTEARAVEWETVPTEIEALILESRLIKLRKPKFNIVMRDDKQYSFVVVTKEEFPHIVLTHQPTTPFIRNSSPVIRSIIGPFTDAGALTTTVRWLRGLFPYCTCKQKHFMKCLNAHIGKCPGYCCLKAPATAAQKKEYARTIRAITDILTGKRDTLIGRLEIQMKHLGKTQKLDEALGLQRRIERIRRVFENAQLVAGRRALTGRHLGAISQLVNELGLADEPKRIEGYDVAHIQGNHPSGAMAVFTDGHPDRAQYRLFNLHADAVGDTAQLREIMVRRLKHDEWPLPDLILVDGGIAQMNTMVRALDSAGHHIPVIALTKNDKHQADHLFSSLDSNIRMLADLPRAMRDLLVHIDTEAHRFSISHYRRRHRKSLVE
ncbi:MAG: GIY-YIG nuclease family protein [Patescibacteria group bacterium]